MDSELIDKINKNTIARSKIIKKILLDKEMGLINFTKDKDQIEAIENVANLHSQVIKEGKNNIAAKKWKEVEEKAWDMTFKTPYGVEEQAVYAAFEATTVFEDDESLFCVIESAESVLSTRFGNQFIFANDEIIKLLEESI